MIRALTACFFLNLLIAAQDEHAHNQIESNDSSQIVDAVDLANITGQELGALYTEYTGFRVLVTIAASEAGFSFSHQASPEKPLPFSEAAALLRIAAGTKGYLFVPDETTPHLHYLIRASDLNNTRLRRGPLTESDPLPEDDVIIDYAMQLGHIKSNQAIDTFSLILGPDVLITAIPNTNVIVVTGKTSTVRKLIDLKKSIDIPIDDTSHFINVKHANATDLAVAMSAHFNPDTDEPSSLQIIAEPRTNRIFVTGNVVDLSAIEAFIRELDVVSLSHP